MTILPQAEPEDDGFKEVVIEAALLGSSCPFLTVPYNHESDLKLDRILVCRDGNYDPSTAFVGCDGRHTSEDDLHFRQIAIRVAQEGHDLIGV